MEQVHRALFIPARGSNQLEWWATKDDFSLIKHTLNHVSDGLELLPGLVLFHEESGDWNEHLLQLGIKVPGNALLFRSDPQTGNTLDVSWEHWDILLKNQQQVVPVRLA